MKAGNVGAGFCSNYGGRHLDSASGSPYSAVERRPKG